MLANVCRAVSLVPDTNTLPTAEFSRRAGLTRDALEVPGKNETPCELDADTEKLRKITVDPPHMYLF